MIRIRFIISVKIHPHPRSGTSTRAPPQRFLRRPLFWRTTTPIAFTLRTRTRTAGRGRTSMGRCARSARSLQRKNPAGSTSATYSRTRERACCTLTPRPIRCCSMGNTLSGGARRRSRAARHISVLSTNPPSCGGVHKHTNITNLQQSSTFTAVELELQLFLLIPSFLLLLYLACC